MVTASIFRRSLVDRGTAARQLQNRAVAAI